MERRLRTAGRFWRVRVEDASVLLHTGAHGTPGTRTSIPCRSPEVAEKTAEALLAQRRRDGFVVDDGAAEREQNGVLEALRPRLLADDLDAWSVLADSLVESGDGVRGEFVALQVRAARWERGAIGKAKAYLKANIDELVGSELGGWLKQASLDWHCGFARTAKVWSGPRSQPMAEVFPALLNSPACRFLRTLELGSPGAEGHYGDPLRALAKLGWPAHLQALTLGAFDVEAARKADSAWPLLESLAPLQPVADRLVTLQVRAVLNTLGRSLVFPKLEALWLWPSRIDARLVSDLRTLQAPKLQRFALTDGAPRSATVESLAETLRELLVRVKPKALALHRFQDIEALLLAIGPRWLEPLDELDLRGSAISKEFAAQYSKGTVRTGHSPPYHDGDGA